jgi:hypothetical protein
MRRIDVPMALPLAKDTRDVAVEDIELVGSTVEGVVRVRNIASEKWFAVRSGRQHRRSPRGTRSPFPIAPWTALSSQSNWQTFLPTRRRTPSISLFDIRLPAAKSGIITVVESTMSKSCVRRCRRLTRRPWLRNLRGLPMWIISQICGTNSSRHSSLAAHPRQLVVFSPSLASPMGIAVSDTKAPSSRSDTDTEL